MKSFIQHLVEATGPEGRDLSKKVDKHFEEIRGFIGAISGGKANEFQDHVQDGVFSGHDNDTIINNHGPLKNHGMVRSDDGDDYSEDIHDYIDAVRAHHEYKTDVRDDSEDFYMGEGKKNCGCGKDPCITYGKQEMNEAKGDLKDMKDVVKELKAASKMHLGQSKRLAKYLDSLKETYGPVDEAANEPVENDVDGDLDWEFVPEYPYPGPHRHPWPIPLKPGDPGYVEPQIPPRWENPYSVPVPIPFPGQPLGSPGFFQPMVNPNYQGPPARVPADPGIGPTRTRPTPFLSPTGPYTPGRRKTYPPTPYDVPRRFRF